MMISSKVLKYLYKACQFSPKMYPIENRVKVENRHAVQSQSKKMPKGIFPNPEVMNKALRMPPGRKRPIIKVQMPYLS